MQISTNPTPTTCPQPGLSFTKLAVFEMAPKLTKSSQAIQLLIRKFRKGEITADHTPYEVWQSENVFQKYKLPTFRARFHKIKKDVLEEKENLKQDNCNDLNRRCSGQAPELKKRKLIDDEASESEEDVECDDEGKEPNNVALDSVFYKPLHIISEWREVGTMTRRISVAMLLPSGIGSGDFSVRVSDGGTHIELCILWPPKLVRMEELNKKWLCTQNRFERIERYHPKISGFEDGLRKFRKKAIDCVESKAHIALPFAVETHIAAKSNLAWKDSTERIIYVDLKAAVETYAVAKDCEVFESI